LHRDGHAGVRTPPQPPLSQGVARLTHLLYRLLKHLLHWALRVAHLYGDGKRLSEHNVSRYADGQAGRQREVCINGNKDTSGQGDLGLDGHGGIDGDIHRRPVWEQWHPHLRIDGHIALERDGEPFGHFEVVFEGNHQLFRQVHLAFEGERVRDWYDHRGGTWDTQSLQGCQHVIYPGRGAGARPVQFEEHDATQGARRQGEEHGRGECQACAAAQAGRRRREGG
jgi:hypothetical protein